MKRVLVIVVTHNGLHWLDRCLGSVVPGAFEAPGAPGAPENDLPGANEASVAPDLYVWDNDSTDGSADFVAAHFPAAKLVRSAENLGFSIPNNKGIQYALDHGYDYVYLLNQDAWLEPGALAQLVATAEAHPEYGLLSPLQMTDGYKELDRQFAKRLPVKPAMTSCPDLIEVPFVMAAHWLVPTRVIKRVGMLEEELFPMWGQDDDYCARLDFCGLKIGVVKEARAVHDRAYREEPLEKLVRRNYYTGSLVRLVDPRRPLWERFLYVLLFTAVKAVKYRSLLPFKYLRKIMDQLPLVKKHRKAIRTRI